MAINDGGPAYPALEEHGLNNGMPGMTLRDAFAIAVVGNIYGRSQMHNKWLQGVAAEAYRLADEMLKVRARTHDATPEQEKP